MRWDGARGKFGNVPSRGAHDPTWHCRYRPPRRRRQIHRRPGPGGEGAVSEAARKKVLAAAGALRYRPNTAARALRRGDNRLLGVVIPNASSRGILSATLQAQKLEGLAHGAKRLGYDLQIFIEDLSDPFALQRLACEKQVRGFFFLGSVQRPTLEFLKRYRIPWMGVNWRHKETPDDPHCWTDFPHAGRTLADHLVRLGCRRVVAFDWLSIEYGPFGRGIREVWELYGLPKQDLALHVGSEYAHGPKVVEALEAAFDAPARPDGLILGHQAGAMEAYRILRARGLRIGADFAVASFDDLDAARNMDPPCTAFAQPAFGMGEACVEEMDRLLEGRAKSPIERNIPGELRVRESSAHFKPAGANAEARTS
ncbi:MAG: LacI family transcriptional regulator [Planctomycetota bacterium]|nr:LacI family transcriptional regulator [Planctomycetota bacterium]